MKKFKTLLEELNACGDAREFAADKTIEQVIAECPRGDWMLWLAKKVDIGLRPLTLAKGHCAATVLHLMKDERSKKAVEVSIAYGENNATDGELRAAADAAAYAAAAYAAAAAAADADAADAAAYAAYAAAADADAADAAAADADAADAAAADAAAYREAKVKNQLATADICRKYIGELIITKVNELLNA